MNNVPWALRSPFPKGLPPPEREGVALRLEIRRLL